MASLHSSKRQAKTTKNTTHIAKAESISPGFGSGITGERWTLVIWGDERAYDLTLSKEEVILVMKHWQKGLDASNAKC